MNFENVEKLRAERDKAREKTEQYTRETNRIKQSIHRTENDIRRQRTHHLCNMGGAIEALSPELAALERVPFYLTMREIFALPDVRVIIAKADQK